MLATSIDGAEHGGVLKDVMAVAQINTEPVPDHTSDVRCDRPQDPASGCACDRQEDRHQQAAQMHSHVARHVHSSDTQAVM